MKTQFVITEKNGETTLDVNINNCIIRNNSNERFLKMLEIFNKACEDIDKIEIKNKDSSSFSKKKEDVIIIFHTEI